MLIGLREVGCPLRSLSPAKQGAKKHDKHINGNDKTLVQPILDKLVQGVLVYA